jgi:riboflavin synthase
MFTGIVTAVGRISQAKPQGEGVRLAIDAPDLGMDDIPIGASIAVQGVCLTVVAKNARGFEADVSRATLAVTQGLEEGREVNLEKALRAGDRLDGHLVAGHVDAVGMVASFEPLGGSTRIVIEAPRELARYLARKGSVAVDGVSLTVNGVEGARFEFNAIPHTLAMTTLGRLTAGARVNLEVDLIARYVERVLDTPKES